jgi:hypothetical protein
MLFLVTVVTLISSAYGVTLSVNSDKGSFTEQVSGESSDRFTGNTLITDSALINSAKGSGNLKENHWVSNKDGAFAEVGVDIKKAKEYQYLFAISPGKGAGWSSHSVQAEEALNVYNAESAMVYANARNAKVDDVGVSTEVAKGSIVDYQNKAWASSDAVGASQMFQSASGSKIKTGLASFLWESPASPNGNANGLQKRLVPETSVSTLATGTISNYQDSAYKSSD